MMYSSHKLVGLLAAVEVSNVFVQSSIGFNPCIGFLSLAVGSMLGSALPDFDTKNSTISQKLKFLQLPVRIIQRILNFASKVPGPLRKPCKEMSMLCSHRGILHTLYCWLIVSLLPLIVIGSQLTVVNRITTGTAFLFGILLGSLSHIVADSVFGGTRLLFPLCKKKIKLSPFRTGGYVEQIVRCILIIELVIRVRVYII